MKNKAEQLSLLQEKNIPGCFTIKLYSRNIIEIIWDNELKEVEKSHLLAIKEIVKDLGKGEKMLVYISTADYLTTTGEARHYGASSDSCEFTKANAVLVDSLAKKIVFNFFLRVNKPVAPTRAFTNKDQAFKWLLTINT